MLNAKNKPLAFAARWLNIGFLLFGLLPLSVSAHGHRVKVVHQRIEYRHITYRGAHFYFRNGHYYRNYRGRYCLTRAPLGLVVMDLPPGAIRLHLGHAHYFFHSGIYYHSVGNRYVVVDRPKTIYLEAADSNAEKPFQEPIAEIISIQNENGSETPVRLESENGKWKGPNGELYDQLPTVEQLKPVYGLDG